jgi:putative NADH-flavin reductase
MRLALFGATGRAGGAILRESRAAGHDVRALVRTPDPPGRDGPRATVIAGDARDPAATARVVDGADAVVSAIGGTRRGNLAVLRDSTTAILGAMQRAGVRRLIVIQGFHLPFPGDPANPGAAAMRVMLRLWNRHLSADTYQMAELLRESDLDWTLIRMPRLAIGAPGTGYRTGQLVLGPWSTVTTGQVAHFTLTCLDTGDFVRQAPMIANARQRPSRPARAPAGRREPSPVSPNHPHS